MNNGKGKAKAMRDADNGEGGGDVALEELDHKNIIWSSTRRRASAMASGLLDQPSDGSSAAAQTNTGGSNGSGGSNATSASVAVAGKRGCYDVTRVCLIYL